MVTKMQNVVNVVDKESKIIFGFPSDISSLIVSGYVSVFKKDTVGRITLLLTAL